MNTINIRKIIEKLDSVISELEAHENGNREYTRYADLGTSEDAKQLQRQIKKLECIIEDETFENE